jgi:hypothetical protein
MTRTSSSDPMQLVSIGVLLVAAAVAFGAVAAEAASNNAGTVAAPGSGLWAPALEWLVPVGVVVGGGVGLLLAAFAWGDGR